MTPHAITVAGDRWLAMAPKVSVAIAELLPATDPSSTVRSFRNMVASRLGLGKEGLEADVDAVNAMIKHAVAGASSGTSQTSTQRVRALIDDVGAEGAQAQQLAYSVTLSRVLPEALSAMDFEGVANMSREEVAAHVQSALNEPLTDFSCPGRRPPPSLAMW